MNIRQIQEARELYGIDDWGAGYFGINDEGHVVCHPTGEEHLSVSLPAVMDQCRKQGLRTPLIVRFPQVIEGQLERMHTAFRNAITDASYAGRHVGVFPFKVNQRREFIDAVVKAGHAHDYGLEVGSKTEFIAALSYKLPEKALMVCNGFKDREFIELGFGAAAMGKNVVIVVEGPDELQCIIDQAKKDDPKFCPEIGLRVRLYSRGAGKWEKSSGESSKFGLTTFEVLNCLQMLEEANLSQKLAMLHFHVGSQITEIKRFKNAIKEASRVYSKVCKMGFKPRYLNIGGGVGVDYDGSKTSFESSANYSLQEFANDAIYVLGEVCNNENVPHPTIVTESGRVIAAYHSVVVTDIREVQGEEVMESTVDFQVETADPKLHKGLNEMKYILDNMNRKNYVEYYHDAVEYQEELFTLFNLGYLHLKDRSLAEELFHRICRKALYYSSFQRHQLEEFENLQKVMVSKYLANFSIFQSIPDSWAIEQLFPVMPLARHDEKPLLKATIVDITCDSDGCLTTFIDRADVKTVLDLHPPVDGTPYDIGFFLVGAYQESLANEHNLFGAIHEVEVIFSEDGDWSISKLTQGDPINELLESRNYDMKEMYASYQEQLNRQIESGALTQESGEKIMESLVKFSKGYPYLAIN